MADNSRHKNRPQSSIGHRRRRKPSELSIQVRFVDVALSAATGRWRRQRSARRGRCTRARSVVLCAFGIFATDGKSGRAVNGAIAKIGIADSCVAE